ncbi:MAG: nitrous oxide reductase accessory protein NosL [Deltaproteobacteria bacterium]|jgi:nitrous oxide reductase accessory protein NosL|nr:nitrous oxide reductase accessory protein NosL [Deltaproteobacteria bacterium]MBW2531386.1 nitrous oxide reductase accessory protein NosL [Deltaproteobacteria bacterium]
MIEPTRRIPSVLRQAAMLAGWVLLVAMLGACRDEKAPAAGVSAAPTAAPEATPSTARTTRSASAAGKSPAKGKPLAADGTMQISPADRCPVCAMKVAEHPKFASAIQLDDDSTYYFCGTGCMLRSWLHPEVFLGADQGELKRAVVPEYFTGKHVDAATVTWVAGSDVVGPMGPAIVPLADDASADKFKERHGGKTTFKTAELDDAKWEKMTGKKAGR